MIGSLICMTCKFTIAIIIIIVALHWSSIKINGARLATTNTRPHSAKKTILYLHWYATKISFIDAAILFRWHEVISDEFDLWRLITLLSKAFNFGIDCGKEKKGLPQTLIHIQQMFLIINGQKCESTGYGVFKFNYSTHWPDNVNASA